MSMPKPLLLALLACGLSGCSLAPLQPTTAMQPVPRSGQSANRVEEWNQLARHHLERGQINLAMGAYAQSLVLDAGQLEARNAVAVIEAQKGRLTVARQALLALTRDYPGEAMPHTNLGYVYYLEGDLVSAKRTLQRAMALGGGSKAFQNLELVENVARLANTTPDLETPAAAETATIGGVAAAPVPLSRLAVSTARVPDTAALTAPREELTFASGMPADAPPVFAAATPAPRMMPPSIPEPAQARMELVQLAPSVFELKQHQAPAVAAAAPAPAVAAFEAAAPASPARLAATAAVPAPAASAQLAPAQASAAQAASAQAVFAQALAKVASAPAASAPAASAQAALAKAASAPATSTQAVLAKAAAAPAASAPAVMLAASAPAVMLAASAPAPGRAAPVVRGAERPVRVRLEVANGNGIEGMARRFRGLLTQMGIPVDRLSNDKPYRQVTTTIQYSPGFEKQAASLQKALQGQAILASRPLQGSDLRLVLGRDAQQTLSNASEASGAALMASTPAPEPRRN